jgi:Flp pilus assembly protein TadG
MNRFIRTFSRRFARNEQGSVILETAVMLLVLLLFAFGIVDFGRVMYVANSLTNATRDAARWTAVQQNIPTATTVQDLVKSKFNSYTFGSQAMVNADVAVTLPTATCTVQTVTILTSYPFKWLTPFPRLMHWTSTSTPMTSTIHAQSIFKYEWCSS